MKKKQLIQPANQEPPILPDFPEKQPFPHAILITILICGRYEGVTNVYHTPYLLSLVNMPRMITEFDIITNETFLLPLQQIWSYVPGSPTSQVFINGDVCGPFFFLGYDDFITSDNYLKKSFAPVEAGIFSFGTKIYNLMYMRQGHGGRNFQLEKVSSWAL